MCVYVRTCVRLCDWLGLIVSWDLCKIWLCIPCMPIIVSTVQYRNQCAFWKTQLIKLKTIIYTWSTSRIGIVAYASRFLLFLVHLQPINFLYHQGWPEPYIYIQIRYFWQGMTKYTVIYGVITRFWPGLYTKDIRTSSREAKEKGQAGLRVWEILSTDLCVRVCVCMCVCVRARACVRVRAYVRACVCESECI